MMETPRGPGLSLTWACFLITEQDRVRKSKECSTRFGSTAIQSVWDHFVTGRQCTGLVRCSTELMSSPLALTSCSTVRPAMPPPSSAPFDTFVFHTLPVLTPCELYCSAHCRRSI